MDCSINEYLDGEDFYGCDDFEDVIAEATSFCKNMQRSVIHNWCDSIGYHGTVAYDFAYGSPNEFTIYSTRPGMLIGKGGKNIDTFKSCYKKVFDTTEDCKVVFKEIRGDFVLV